MDGIDGESDCTCVSNQHRRRHGRESIECINVIPEIFGGKPIIRGHRLAVEHVLGMLAAGDDLATILEGYPWLERDDILACLAYAHKLVEHERIEPMFLQPA